MKTTKQYIKDHALKLFNQSGFVNVRLQHIADAAFISVGHLAYHFKNKDSIINELYDKSDIIWSSNYYIYIRSCPHKCYERILSRGRPNELSISDEYLNEIHNLHEETYKKALDDGLNVICIDIEDKTIDEIASIILNYIKHL